MARFFLMPDSPNNTIFAHYGIWDREADDYAWFDGDLCWGMRLGEAEATLEALNAQL